MFDLTNKVFGFLVVLRRSGTVSASRQVRWTCRCECGAEHDVSSRELRKGRVKSCGCKKVDLCRKANIRHGAWANGKVMPEWRIWQEMKQRCENPQSNRFYTHGARGVAVCDRWRNSFEAFLEDMGPRTESGLSLERRDNDKGYCPENCYWATKTQQARNRRNNVLITFNGVTHCVAEWSELTGVKASIIRSRLKRGATPEEALKRI